MGQHSAALGLRDLFALVGEGMSTELRIVVYDQTRHEWRAFLVVPYDANFKVSCRDTLHQLWPSAPRCACGGVQRT